MGGYNANQFSIWHFNVHMGVWRVYCTNYT
jgi:hypothetical protein